MEEVGSHPVSLEHSPESAEVFVKKLEKLIDKESSTIRETELDSHKFKLVWVRPGVYCGTKIKKIVVMVDKLGRVHIPNPVVGTSVKEISFDNITFRKVIKAEERFDNDVLTSVVCYLETPK